MTGDGDDTMLSGLGGVRFDGGAGSDTADDSNSEGSITVSLKAGTCGRGDAKGDPCKSVEYAIGTNYDDTFVFSNQNSDPGDMDTIVDFNTGEDLIDLSGTIRDSRAEILHGNWELVGNDTVLNIGNGHDLVLQDVQFSSLSDTDFIF